MDHFNLVTFRLHMARQVMGIFILHDLGDVSDTKMACVTSTFLFLWLVQMFHLVVVAGILSNIVAGVEGGRIVSIVAEEDDGIGNGEVKEVSISNQSLTL